MERPLRLAVMGGMSVIAGGAAWLLWGADVPTRQATRQAGLEWTRSTMAGVADWSLLRRSPQEMQASFPGSTLSPVDGTGCERRLSAPPSAYLARVDAVFDGMPGEPCSSALPTTVTLELRRSQGVSLASVLGFLVRGLGQPDSVLGDTGAGENTGVDYQWQPLPRLSVSLGTYSLPPMDGHMVVTLRRGRGTPAGVPPEAEGAAWLDGYLDRISGPGFKSGHGMEDASRLGASEALMPQDGTGCQQYVTLEPGKVAWLQLVTIQAAGDGPARSPAACERLPLDTLHASIWKAPGVSPEAAVRHLTERFGQPVTEPPGSEDVRVTWKADGLRVSVLDRFAGTLRHTFEVGVSRLP